MNSVYLHRVLSDPDRIRVMDYIAASADPVIGRQIANDMNMSEVWMSRSLNQMADVGLIVRDSDSNKDAFSEAVRNRLAPDIIWPLGLNAAAHHALINDSRIAIMDHLADFGPTITGNIAKSINATPSTASKHLATLDRVGLITRTRLAGGIVQNAIAAGIVWPMRVRK